MRGGNRALLVVLVAVAGLSGCQSAEEGRREIFLRFIEQAPEEIFEPGALIRREPVLAWRLDDREEAARWASRGGEGLARTVRAEGGALAALGKGFLVRPVDLDAAAFDTLELSVSEPPRGTRFTLSWAGPGEGFSARRRLQVSFFKARSGARRRIRFDLGDHPAWRGPIRRLGLGVVPPVEEDPRPIHLWGLAGFRTEAPPAALAEALERPWQVDLDGDVRSALAAVPGSLHERELEVPPGARLRFAYGALGTLGAPVELRAEAVLASGPPQELFSARIDPNRPTPGWEQAEIDLDPWAGRQVRLCLQALGAEADPGPGGEGPLVFWGHPEVLRPRRGPAPPNALLISVDTLRPDRLGVYGYRRTTSPHLDAWARRRATVFLQAVAQAPWTLPSHVSMLTGLDAHRHGVNHSRPAPASLELLAERLRREGYITAAVTGGGFLHPGYGFSQGFDRYVHFNRSPQGEDELAWELERALAAVAEHRDVPLFLFFHTYEVHAPFLPRQPHFSEFSDLDEPPALEVVRTVPSPEDGFLNHKSFALHGDGGQGTGARPEDVEALVGALYDSGIAYTDAQIRHLLAEFERVAPRSGSLVVFTSDHGETLGEDGLAGHGYLNEETLRVPLVIQAPDGRGAGRRIERQVRSIDIVPTALELLGLAPASGIDGRSLAGLMTGREPEPAGPPEEAWSYASKSNQGISLRLGNRLKYVLNPTAWATIPRREALYDLRRDPQEENNLAATGTDGGDLRQRALQALTQAAPGLRLRLANPGPGPFSGVLRGPAISPSRVELLSPPCACVRWDGEERAAFTVAPGGEHLLLLEEVEASELSITLDLPDGDPFETRLRLDDLDGPRTLGRGTDGVWRWTDGPAGALTGSLTFWWHGDARPGAGDAAGEDETLREQLRALGYL